MNYFRVGDIYEFSAEATCYGLLVTKKEFGYCTFININQYQKGIGKIDFLIKSSINYHQHSQSFVEKFLTLFLGGDNPEGYFGFMASEEIVQEISPNLQFRFCLNKLKSDDLFQVGVTSLARENELERILECCENFQLSKNKTINLKLYG